MNLTAPLQATVVEWLVAVGDAVTKDQVVVILEAMKMEHEVKAGFDGRLTECFAKMGVLCSKARLWRFFASLARMQPLCPLARTFPLLRRGKPIPKMRT
jgi:3-methylcrotonyl-CoA carboxylase alpha subunit